MLGFAVFGDQAFEFRDLRALRYPAAADDFGSRLGFFFAEIGDGDGDQGRCWKEVASGGVSGSKFQIKRLKGLGTTNRRLLTLMKGRSRCLVPSFRFEVSGSKLKRLGTTHRRSLTGMALCLRCDVFVEDARRPMRRAWSQVSVGRNGLLVHFLGDAHC